MKKVYDETTMKNGEKFAILVDDETKEAFEAVWDKENNQWSTDFSYSYLQSQADEVAESLDFDGCRTNGFVFTN